MRAKREYIKKHIHKKLLQRLRIFFVISLILLGVAIYEVVKTGFDPILSVGIGLIGLLIGLLVSRSLHIFWDAEEQVIASRIDRIGGVILGGYILFSISRQYLISHLVEAQLVFVITFALVAGIMIGRVIGMRKTVISILKKQEII